MKFIILITLFALVAAENAYNQKAEKSYDEYEEVHAPAQPYSYGYAIKDDETYNEFSHNVKADGNVVEGSYRIALPDGRTQIVTYRADKNGNVAEVTYEGEARYPEYVEPEYKPSEYRQQAQKKSEYREPEYQQSEYKEPEYEADKY